MAANVQPAPAASQLVEACPSCGIELQGKFCHKCGEKEFHRHDLSVKHFLLHALGEFTHLNSKIFATLRYLFTRPGYLTLEYTSGRKAKYMKPLGLFLLAVHQCSWQIPFTRAPLTASVSSTKTIKAEIWT
jgi:hypothetical protein